MQFEFQVIKNKINYARKSKSPYQPGLRFALPFRNITGQAFTNLSPGDQV